MSLVVSKFGGTSMQDADCMRRAAQISKKQSSFLVVVSATSGTTNDLIALGEEAAAGKNVSQLIDKIKTRHLQIADQLKADNKKLNSLFADLQKTVEQISKQKEMTLSLYDELVSYGERMSSLLFVHAMGELTQSEWLDAREFLITDSQFSKARPQISLMAEKCKKIQKKNVVYVTQGFIGSTEDGHTTTLGRGGSDYSAALFAEALNADVLEIWTDVAGIATTDPRICPDAKPILEISFKEASELATFGAKVLHPATLAPAMRKNIPVFVGSSFDPDQSGTWVKKELKSAPSLRALALRKNQTLVTLTTPDMLNAHGFLYKIFKVFNDHRVSVDAITTSEISVALTLDGKYSPQLIEDLSQFAEVAVEDNLSLVALIGNNVNYTPGLAQKIFSTIPDINIRMICQGASRHNFCFLVAGDRGAEAIKRLHAGLI